jgi:hypothetical protein
VLGLKAAERLPFRLALPYGEGMRVNFLLLAGLLLGLAVMQVLKGNYVAGGAGLTVAALLAVVHFIRVRRFRRFDERAAQRRTFD